MKNTKRIRIIGGDGENGTVQREGEGNAISNGVGGWENSTSTTAANLDMDGRNDHVPKHPPPPFTVIVKCIQSKHPESCQKTLKCTSQT